ncbi:Hsp33 family molecular chaperone HslO [Hazenella sp. IB182353]|uniref:Hsp33 family molecular chaperone HslO n=1 Tax=Polycladospora coralii TaxID=2771432 RepID=UPI0017460120|nr:Hsp33 family molecular chaperone HslO [Polycladospora coralii]
MSDYAIRAISKDKQIRAFAATTRHLVQELQSRHQTLPVASAALGRTATMGTMLGLTLKEQNHKLTITVDGDGPLGKIVVDANGQGDVRGYVDNPAVMGNALESYKLNVGEAVGKGTIYVVKDLGLREPYRGTSPIVSGELGDDFTYYLVSSDQVPSSVGLGVNVKKEEILSAGGYMVQVMPEADEDSVQQLEERISQIESISELLKAGITPEELLYKLLGEDAEILEKHYLRFACKCSRERTHQMLRSLGKDEITGILKELGEAEVVCHFCNEKYQFDAHELEQMLFEIKRMEAN